MKAFVIMPFAPEFDEIYNLFIATTLIEAGFEVFRADDILSQRNILEDIVRSVADSDLIVADLTGANPNVYYELGLAHALGKPVVLLTQSVEELPFDLRSYRVVTYNTHFATIQKAKTELYELASGAKDGSVPFGNPIRDFALDIITVKNFPTTTQEDTDGELGILDHMVEMEEGFESLTKILFQVGEWTESIGAKTAETGERVQVLNQNSQPGNVRKVQTLAHMLGESQLDYGKKLSAANDSYNHLLGRLETSLEYVIGAQESLTVEQSEQLKDFLNTLSGIEESALGGRASFAALAETVERLPKMERQLSHACQGVSTQLRRFVGNIDQTIAMISRARGIGERILRHANAQIEMAEPKAS